MVDKVQKIREYLVGMASAACCDAKTKKNIETNILPFIDSMQKEPVSIDFEQELYKAFGQVKDFTLGMRIAKWFYEIGRLSSVERIGKYWKEEPISEDFEKIVEEIAEPTILNAYGTKELARRLRNTICGTSVSEELEEVIDTYLATYWGGEKEKQDWPFLKKMAIHFAEWQKEQMMAKAVDGDITFDYYGDDDKTYGCIAHDSFCLEDFGLKDRDKVKVFVIKEG